LQYSNNYQKKKPYWNFGIYCLYLHPQIRSWRDSSVGAEKQQIFDLLFFEHPRKSNSANGGKDFRD
jgi:hypothetical protein